MIIRSEKDCRKLFNSFKNTAVLIVGDVMLDSYVWGKVERISPEAPVPIVNVQTSEHRLGGAANVAINLLELGAKPILCSVVGKDDKGKQFIDILKKLKLDTEGLLVSAERPTTQKMRVIGNQSQMLRIDEESDQRLSKTENDLLLKKIHSVVQKHPLKAIIFEDYDKGVIGTDIIASLRQLASAHNIPVVVDPKKRNFHQYTDVRLFKPNLKELREGMGMELDLNHKNEFFAAVEQFRAKQNIDIMLVTLSEHGVLVHYNQKGKTVSKIIPAHLRNIADVSGAGDTLTAVAALCLAADTDPETLAKISNLAGGLVCEKTGVVPVNREQLFKETLQNFS